MRRSGFCTPCSNESTKASTYSVEPGGRELGPEIDVDVGDERDATPRARAAHAAPRPRPDRTDDSPASRSRAYNADASASSSPARSKNMSDHARCGFGRAVAAELARRDLGQRGRAPQVVTHLVHDARRRLRARRAPTRSCTHHSCGGSCTSVPRQSNNTAVERRCLRHPRTLAIPGRMTYSIVARDPDTGALGVAVQTCMFAVGAVVPWARAGVGAVATQAFGEPLYGPALSRRDGRRQRRARRARRRTRARPGCGRCARSAWSTRQESRPRSPASSASTSPANRSATATRCRRT